MYIDREAYGVGVELDETPQLFDSIETVKKCLSVFIPMIDTMKPIPENMKKAAQNGFINATDLADYLVGKGLPFRSAYKTVGQIVGYCVQNKTILEDISLEKYKEFDSNFDEDLYKAIDLQNCVNLRISAGGTGIESVNTQIAQVKEFLMSK